MRLIPFHARARFLGAATALFTAAALTACATSPTGRSQIKLVSDAQMAQMGAAAYTELKQNQPISRNSRVNNYVNCVSYAITAVVPERQAWEVTVFDDDSANAFALPGGKIGVHTGLLKVAENQSQLAAVVGHEIAHVLADHGNERVSTNQLASTGLQIVQVALGDPSPAKQQLFGLLGIGAQVGVLLPFSRIQESEADVLGINYMAAAGFDPRESVQLWRNMAANSGGQNPPEFLSTHPSSNSRISRLQDNMPRALEIYNQARTQGKRPSCG